MINYNKIESLINKERLTQKRGSEILGIKSTTYQSRLERKIFTPDDIEKLADYWGKSILYFFDREENNGVTVVQDGDINQYNSKTKIGGDVNNHIKADQNNQIIQLRNENELLRDTVKNQNNQIASLHKIINNLTENK